ncbi:MAG: branched-chain amino acid ABC transporter ATP-binding protein/permease [Alphaproteobacteria bacterium]|nr:branched-chain amino acid ABC transporter ATP-binding protein/permease [Alphaproteobacteria bacterium]
MRVIDRRLILGLGCLALAAWPFVFSDPYGLRLFTLAGIYAIAVLGYQFIFGHAGALSLAQGTFFGLGAYLSGLLAIRFGASFDLSLPAAVLGCAALAALIALPVLRLHSHYFALATLGIGQVVLIGAINWESVTGGANGLPGVPPIQLFDVRLGRAATAALVWSLVAVGAAFAWQLTRGLDGRMMQLLRAHPLAAASLGVDEGRVRLIMLVLSAAYGGAAGALYVHSVRVVSPEALEFPVMVSILAMTVIGGSTSAAGAVIGAFLLVHLPEWFRVLEDVYLLAYGAGLLGFILFAPAGLAGLFTPGTAPGWALRAGLDGLIAPRNRPAGAMPVGKAPRALTAASLNMEGVGKSFGGVVAVDDLSLTVRSGEIHGLIGPNGSGKTTVLNLISGLVPSDAGAIHFDGQDLRQQRAFQRARAGMARTFQTPHLLGDLPVLENAALGVASRAALQRSWQPSRMGARWAVAKVRGAWALTQVGLEAQADLPADGLSPGGQRRLEIARALASGARLLLLDEPAAGMSAAEQAELADCLRGLRDRGYGLLIVEHNVRFLTALCDRLTCLDAGRVIASGEPEAVCADPAVREAYLGPDYG